ncbi:hypothetical protein OOU_Y34scaffold00946g4 [Pyricularia oryzae Y34]|uniref:Uncharacterized protein n=3 Tax=Pyricularia oryzae TaxID=318829 RepID=A0A4V1C702_PYROR|nr:hypothetical protein OOU_Y34scaffold00946g4 [Pyricularia oryzae Y34]QBZ61678.1 hypothetical protein PoMZ_08632 [Pyricularia oryzae]
MAKRRPAPGGAPFAAWNQRSVAMAAWTGQEPGKAVAESLQVCRMRE